MAVALDLDGVVWLGDDPIAGSAEAVARLRAEGERLAFVTNNSYFRLAEVEAKLRSHGIEPQADVITSAMAAALLVEPGETALVCGGPGVVEELAARGATVVHDGRADVVVVGFDWGFDYERMRVASCAIRGGARLVATNDDRTYPTPEGPIPGAGAILASIVAASGATPDVAGKPHRAMVRLVLDRLGPDGIMIGDRPETDGRFASALGFRFGLVLSGVTRSEDLSVEPAPDLVAEDLASAVSLLSA